MAPSERPRSIRALRDTLVGYDSVPAFNTTRRVAYRPPIAVSLLVVKARTPALGYLGIRMVIEWIMVAHVDSSDCR
jgi:hypothetical protein